MNEFTADRQTRRHLQALTRKHLSKLHPEVPAQFRAGMGKSGGDYAWNILVAMADGASMEEAQERAMLVVHARYGCAGEEAWSALHTVVTTVLEEAGYISWQEGPRPDLQ